MWVKSFKNSTNALTRNIFSHEIKRANFHCHCCNQCKCWMCSPPQQSHGSEQVWSIENTENIALAMNYVSNDQASNDLYISSSFLYVLFISYTMINILILQPGQTGLLAACSKLRLNFPKEEKKWYSVRLCLYWLCYSCSFLVK